MKEDTANHAFSTLASASINGPYDWYRVGAPQRVERKPNVLSRLYELVAWGQTDRAIDVLFDLVDKMLSAGNYAQCGSLLTKIDLTRLNVDLVVALLSISYPARRKLVARGDFIVRARAFLAQGLPPDEVAALLHGLDQ